MARLPVRQLRGRVALPVRPDRDAIPGDEYRLEGPAEFFPGPRRGAAGKQRERRRAGGRIRGVEFHALKGLTGHPRRVQGELVSGRGASPGGLFRYRSLPPVLISTGRLAVTNLFLPKSPSVRIWSQRGQARRCPASLCLYRMF